MPPEGAPNDRATTSIGLLDAEPDPDGRWAGWAASRRAQVQALGLDAPGTVIDLTGPEARLYADDRPSTVPPGLVRNAAIAIVVLNLLDIVTTSLALSRGATEGNPIADLFVHNLWLFVFIKVALPGTVAYRLWKMRDRMTAFLLSGMWWVVGVYSMVITINALHLL